ncbi:hypothetical protein SDJN03_16276, partial [Cucurbita argyrosperma subsp. sororia]
MERVFAFRKESKNLRLLEFVEANGAFKAFLLTAQRPKSKNRQRFNYRLVDAGVLPRREARSTYHRIGISRVPNHHRIPTLAVLSVEKKKERDRESGSENADNHRHARPERRVDGDTKLGEEAKGLEKDRRGGRRAAGETTVKRKIRENKKESGRVPMSESNRGMS